MADEKMKAYIIRYKELESERYDKEIGKVVHLGCNGLHDGVGDNGYQLHQ